MGINLYTAVGESLVMLTATKHLDPRVKSFASLRMTNVEVAQVDVYRAIFIAALAGLITLCIDAYITINLNLTCEAYVRILLEVIT